MNPIKDGQIQSAIRLGGRTPNLLSFFEQHILRLNFGSVFRLYLSPVGWTTL